MLKKFLSVILSVIMIFAMSLSSFAANVSDETIHTAVVNINDGKLYTSTSATKDIAILTNDQQHLLDISISYSSAPNVVYQWTIWDYPAITFTPSVSSFWNDIIDYAESRKDSANIVYFTEVSYEEPIEIPQTRSSAGADLLEALEEEMGTGEYFDNLKYQKTYEGEVCRVYESMDFRIESNGSKSWSSAINVSSLIVGVLGLVTTNTLVSAICGAFGVATSAASLIPAGKINKYICRAMNYRYVTINGSEYVYNIADKFIDYNGYENASDDNKERAYIDTGSRAVDYPQGSSYFNSYTSQIEDTYEMFLRIGQMD